MGVGVGGWTLQSAVADSHIQTLSTVNCSREPLFQKENKGKCKPPIQTVWCHGSMSTQC